MNFKKLMVSFVMMVSALFLMSTVSANFGNVVVTVDDLSATEASVVAGQLVTVEIFFTATSDASDVKVKVELEGNKVDIDEVTTSFDVEAGKRYKKVLTLRVPYELQDEISDDVELNLKIWGGKSTTYTDSFNLRVQRPTYNVGFMSVETSQSVQSGKNFPVDIVLKNNGYNDLDDLYVTVSIPELNVEETTYFGDIISVETEDDDDFIRGRVFLKVPYNTVEGTYALNVEVRNGDLRLNRVEDLFIENDFSSGIVVSGNEITLLNPTGDLMALRLVPEIQKGVSVGLSQDVVVVPAGSSRTVTVSASGSNEYRINVFKMNGELVESVTMQSTDSLGNSAVTVLTVILLIVFLVLLAVLVVLITKKPQKEEEFGESYY